MHIKKKIAALTLTVFTLVSVTAGAEQAKAEEYRQLFASGNFYVKYGVGATSQFDRSPGITVGMWGKIRVATMDTYKPDKAFFVVCGEHGKRMKGIYTQGGNFFGLGKPYAGVWLSWMAPRYRQKIPGCHVYGGEIL